MSKAPDVATRPYHHGDLPAALLQAALAILEQEGIAGLTLRAVARRAGVSHMAPAHHFGDLSGLLSELAAEGYRRFAARLGAAGEGDRLDGMGEAYVAFARDNQALFQLMFRSERLDPTRPALAAAMAKAADMLTRAAGGFTQNDAAPSLEQVAASIRAWSLVHGFALLLIDGRLDTTLAFLGTGTGTGTGTGKGDGDGKVSGNGKANGDGTGIDATGLLRAVLNRRAPG